MNQIYDLPDGRKAAVYTEEHRIMFYIFPVRHGGNMVVLREDYVSDLSHILFYGTIYYAYVNRQGNILLDGIGSGEEKIIEVSEGNPEQINLITAAGNIYLLWIERRKNNCRLCVCAPYGSGTVQAVTEAREQFYYGVIRLENTVLLATFRGKMILTEKIWQEGGFCDTLREDLNTELKELRERTGILEKEAQEERRAYRNSLEMEQYRNEELDRTVLEYEKELQYAKKKYDELAEFAERLQNAVKQWREMYMEEI